MGPAEEGFSCSASFMNKMEAHDGLKSKFKYKSERSFINEVWIDGVLEQLHWSRVSVRKGVNPNPYWELSAASQSKSEEVAHSSAGLEDEESLRLPSSSNNLLSQTNMTSSFLRSILLRVASSAALMLTQR